MSTSSLSRSMKLIFFSLSLLVFLGGGCALTRTTAVMREKSTNDRERTIFFQIFIGTACKSEGMKACLSLQYSRQEEQCRGQGKWTGE